MVGFEVWLPTKIIFGLGQISRVGDLTSKYGKNAMLVTGKHHARSCLLYTSDAADE